MALKTKCLTPGFIYRTSIKEDGVEVKVDFGGKIDLSKAEAKTLERLLHNQIEVALATITERLKKTP